MTIIEQILSIKKDTSILWQYGKSKKDVLGEIQEAVDGLIAAKKYLPETYKINEVVGVPEWFQLKDRKVGMSYCQISNYVKYIIRTGRLLKRPYKIANHY